MEKNKYIFSNFIIILKMINHQIDSTLTNECAKELLAPYVNFNMLKNH